MHSEFLVQDGLIDLDRINGQIRSFPYGPGDKENKPIEIHNLGDHMKQTAARMWYLVRLLPFLIGHIIPEGNQYWQLFLGLKLIIEIVFAPQLNTDILAYLHQLIQEHLLLFCELFPDKNLKPKQHYLIHYPQHLLDFGPLRRCWCMRFEAKHNYFRRLIAIVKNFKNVCKTLAVRHQMLQTYYFGSSSDYLRTQRETSVSVTVSVDTLCETVQRILAENDFSDRFLDQVSFLVWNGNKYRVGMYVVIDIEDGDLVFGEIISIYISRAKHLFLCKRCTSHFRHHFGAYKVYDGENFHAVTVDKLLDYYPLNHYWVQNIKLISLKHYIIDEAKETH